MPIGPVELLFCLFGLLIIPAGVAIAVMMRREHLEWQQKALEGLRYAAATALIAIVFFVFLILLTNVR